MSESHSKVSLPPLMPGAVSDVGFQCADCNGVPSKKFEEGIGMKIGLLVRIEAKPEHADEIEQALRGAQELAEAEPETVAWFSFRQSATVFGVFDTFDDDHGRQAHLSGPIAAALGQFAGAAKLAAPPVITEIDLLGVKVP
jgi:quinol monooxygenase YgiN